jgi:hypothetical protein
MVGFPESERPKRSTFWEPNAGTDLGPLAMSLFLLPWAESLERKVTLPSEKATSLWLEMATPWV